MTNEEEVQMKFLSDSYSSLKQQYKLLKEECAEKGRKNAILNDKYLEALRKIKYLEADTPDHLLMRIHGLQEKVEILTGLQTKPV
jgi:hypothetical protein